MRCFASTCRHAFTRIDICFYATCFNLHSSCHIRGAMLFPNLPHCHPTSNTADHQQQRPKRMTGEEPRQPLIDDASPPPHCIGHAGWCTAETWTGQKRKGMQRSVQIGLQPAPANAARSGRLAPPPNVNPCLNNENDPTPRCFAPSRNQISTLLLRTAVTRQRCCDPTLRSRARGNLHSTRICTVVQCS